MQDEEWGPWIEHDGKHRPQKGVLVEREYANGLVRVALIGSPGVARRDIPNCPPYSGPTYACSWGQNGWGLCVPVIRYRIRKPRALLDLIERARELADAPEGPRVTRKVPA